MLRLGKVLPTSMYFSHLFVHRRARVCCGAWQGEFVQSLEYYRQTVHILKGLTGEQSADTMQAELALIRCHIR